MRYRACFHQIKTKKGRPFQQPHRNRSVWRTWWKISGKFDHCPRVENAAAEEKMRKKQKRKQKGKESSHFPCSFTHPWSRVSGTLPRWRTAQSHRQLLEYLCDQAWSYSTKVTRSHRLSQPQTIPLAQVFCRPHQLIPQCHPRTRTAYCPFWWFYICSSSGVWCLVENREPFRKCVISPVFTGACSVSRRTTGLWETNIFSPNSYKCTLLSSNEPKNCGFFDSVFTFFSLAHWYENWKILLKNSKILLKKTFCLLLRTRDFRWVCATPMKFSALSLNVSVCVCVVQAATFVFLPIENHYHPPSDDVNC